MDPATIAARIVGALTWVWQALVDSFSSSMPRNLALGLATLVFSLIPATIVYVVTRLLGPREIVDRIVFYALAALWIAALVAAVLGWASR